MVAASAEGSREREEKADIACTINMAADACRSESIIFTALSHLTHLTLIFSHGFNSYFSASHFLIRLTRNILNARLTKKEPLSKLFFSYII